MGDAHSSSGLPTRLRLDKADEVLVLHDLAVRLRELRVAVHSLGFQGCEAGLRVVVEVMVAVQVRDALQVHGHRDDSLRQVEQDVSERVADFGQIGWGHLSLFQYLLNLLIHHKQET